MKTSIRMLGLAVLLAVSCGGDGGDGPAGPGNNGGGGNTFTATIDGTNWKSDAALIQVGGAVNLGFIIGPATQPLGVNPGTNPGGVGTILKTDFWETPLNGQAGFVTITARTDKRIAGTFHFSADGLNPGTVPASRNVTNGKFDITIASGLPDLPTGVGSTSTANMGGTPWNAATMVGIRQGPGAFVVTASTTNSYTYVLTTIVPITTIGAYGIGTQVSLQVTNNQGAQEWAAGGGPDVGTLNITSIDAGRIVGNFTASVPAVGAGSALTIAGGTINAFLQQEK